MFITEHKLNLFGETKKYQCLLLEQLESKLTILYQLPKEIALEHIVLPKETISIGHFWWQQNYNCYHFINAQGTTLAAYFNISDPPRLQGENIYWRDLVVDILKIPNTKPMVLDEDELPENIDAALAKHIYQSCDEVIRNIDMIMTELELYATQRLPLIKASCQDS